MRRKQLSGKGATNFIILLSLFALFCLPLSAMTASPGEAAEYDSEEAGHPLRIVAYAVHPAGVILEYILYRPAYWIVQKEPFATLFGHNAEFGNNRVKPDPED